MKKTKLSVWDFDGTLVNTPIASPENKKKWEKHYGLKWEYLGWWGRDESMDTNVWEMPVVQEVFNDYKKEVQNPENLMVLLTGRLKKQENIVKNIVNDRGYYFDHYLFNSGGNTLNEKIKYLNMILNRYPNIREVEMWDDRPKHFGDFKNWGQEMKSKGRIDSFYLNEIQSDQWTNFVE